MSDGMRLKVLRAVVVEDRRVIVAVPEGVADR